MDKLSRKGLINENEITKRRVSFPFAHAHSFTGRFCLGKILRSLCIPRLKLHYRFVNFPDQPAVWREISVITAALRNDSQDKQTQFLRGEACSAQPAGLRKARGT